MPCLASLQEPAPLTSRYNASWPTVNTLIILYTHTRVSMSHTMDFLLTLTLSACSAPSPKHRLRQAFQLLPFHTPPFSLHHTKPGKVHTKICTAQRSILLSPDQVAARISDDKWIKKPHWCYSDWGVWQIWQALPNSLPASVLWWLCC